MQEFLEQVTFYIDLYGPILIIILSILHPFVAFPAHIFVLTASITLFGIVHGYLYLVIGNIMGIVIFYFIVGNFKFNEDKEDKNVLHKISDWVKNEPTWKHIVVIGAPLIPTHVFKYMMPLTGMSFRRYLLIFISAYSILFLSNTLLYFGTLSFVTDVIPNYVGVIFITLFILFVYFGKYVFKRSELYEKK